MVNIDRGAVDADKDEVDYSSDIFTGVRLAVITSLFGALWLLVEGINYFFNTDFCGVNIVANCVVVYIFIHIFAKVVKVIDTLFLKGKDDGK